MAIIRNPLIVGYHTTFPGPGLAKPLQWSLDARRATIFFRRAKASAGNLEKGIDTKVFGTHSPDTSDHSLITPYREALSNKQVNPIYGENSPNVPTPQNYIPNQGQELSDYVAIVDLDYAGPNNEFSIIKLPFIPKELEWNSESTFAAIKPIGRNTAIYHYTGAEDKLEFEIDWYAFDWGRREVIENCRKIEALSKADGYSNKPHRVSLLWGKDGLLFHGMEFIVLSAPYRLTQFNKGNINSQGQAESTHMMPVQGYQKLSLGRISSNNLSTIEIEYVHNK